MADENSADLGEPLANGEDTGPAVGVISQYVKDLSFENPNSPAIFQTEMAPSVDVQFNIGFSQVGEDVYEVVLKIDVKAQQNDKVAFVVDLSYAGLFGMRNIPADSIEPFLLGEAPRIIFPFARRILADAVRDGGFPIPLLLEPIDFGGLYMQRMEAQAQGAGAEAGNA
ncbi:MAG: protein-export chaperone SecB [Pseudomonadota bacterium]